jgi:EmrB/QacA subfamily drug resistance transporter
MIHFTKIITYAMIIFMTASSRLNSPNARWIALVVVCFAQLMSIVDATIVNVALPSIQRTLHFSSADLTWVVNSYLISFGSFLLFAGRLGDLIGRRRIFLVGVAIFTVASAVCGIASSQTVLIVARFVQGFGGAGATSAIMAIITVEFVEPRERAKAMGVYMFVVSCGGSLGLLAGGLITQTIDWHWIFFINVPVGIATFLLGRVWIAENQGLGIGRDVDAVGPVLITSSMVLTAYTIVTSSQYGWGSPHTFAFGGLALALLTSFTVLEARLRNPIMPLRIFRIRGLASSSLIRGLLITGMYASFFIGVLYLQHVRHYGVLHTGVAFLPQTLTLAALSFGLTARVVNRFGAVPPLLVGLAACAGGLGLLAGLGTHTGYLTGMLPAFVLIGLGAGLAFMPLLTIAMANVPAADAGMASGIVNTSLQLAGAIGVAVLGTVAADRTRALTVQGQPHTAALLGGYHLAFLVALGCAGAAVVAAGVTLRQPRRSTLTAAAPAQAAEAGAALIESEAA